MIEKTEIHTLNKDTLNSLNVGEVNGVYALLNKNSEVDYVGRSSNLKKRLLRQCVTYPHLYEKFAYFEFESSKEAYLLECNLYHNYNPKNNRNHPDKQDASWSCPICDGD